MEEGLGDRITQSLSPGNEIRDVVNADRDSLAWGVLVWSGRVDLEPERLCIGRNLYRIGRNDCCDIVLKEGSFDKDYLAGVSRRHFAVCRSNDGQSFTVRDLSRNGTYLNRRKMPKSSELPLRHGDRIGLFGRNDKHQIVFLSTSYMRPGVDEELSCSYILVESIDRGSFGEVTLALQRKTLSKFAVKSVRHLRVAGPHSPIRQIRNEANALRSLCHPCIVHIEEVISARLSVYLVLEFMAGGNLLERINKSAPQMLERLVKFYFLQIALAVQYCHSKGVIHRDLKPENVLLSSCQDITVVKITDFGLCKLAGSAQGPVAMGTYCGTPLYLAPEVIRARMQRSRYSSSVDIWSLGVILFLCLSGYTPFTLQTSTRSLEKQILSGEFKYRAERWKRVSPDGYDLVCMMLNVDADSRPTMDQVLEHCWICDADVRSSVDAVVFPVHHRRALCDTRDDDDFDDVPLSKRLRHI